MNKFYFILLFVAILFACSEENDENTTAHKKSSASSVNEVVGIETLFNDDEFTDSIHKKLLIELRICSQFQKDTANYMQPACSPRFFKIFPMRDDAPEKDAFLLQIKSKVSGVKLRRLVTFVRERGELVKCNTFVANLIGVRKSASHYYDLILRFNDNIGGEIVFYNCIFSWEKSKYVFKSVELIEGATWRQRLKPEFKDSVSNEIYGTLVENKMVM
jgi:hypothetical protein